MNAFKRCSLALPILIGAAVLLSPVHAADIGPKVVYGKDDRIDLYETKDARLLKLAESTVALFPASSVSIDGEGKTAQLSTSHYGQSRNLCKEEPFFDQPVGAFCSGSLVGPDLLMTAGHCVRSAEACAQTKFVFGFNVKTKGVYPKSVPAGEVYGCKELLGREEVGSGADWALIRLDRSVPNHAPLQINRSGDAPNGTPLVVIGHPAGLPVKIAGGAAVRNSAPEGYFVANLDTYGGNSGSAVFNNKTGLIEGILVRGEWDYTNRNGCTISNVCADDGCRGEDVTKISALAAQIPATLRRPQSLDALLGQAPPQAASLGQLERLGGLDLPSAPKAPETR